MLRDPSSQLNNGCSYQDPVVWAYGISYRFPIKFLTNFKTSLSLPEKFKISKKVDAGCIWKRR